MLGRLRCDSEGQDHHRNRWPIMFALNVTVAVSLVVIVTVTVLCVPNDFTFKTTSFLYKKIEILPYIFFSVPK